MTGRDIPAREAEQLGLVNMVVPDDEVDARALQMAKETAANAPDAVQLALFGESKTMPDPVVEGDRSVLWKEGRGSSHRRPAIDRRGDGPTTHDV